MLIIASAGVDGLGNETLNVPLVAVLFPEKSNTTHNLSPYNAIATAIANPLPANAGTESPLASK